MKNQQAICTIVTSDYIDQAMLLGKSVKNVEPESDYVVFVVDYNEHNPNYQKCAFSVLDAKILYPFSSLDNKIFHYEEWNRFVFQYNGLAASCSLKPLALLHLLQKYEKVIFLDADIKLLRSLHEAWDSLDRGSLSLTPHNNRPIKNDGFFPSYQDLCLGGIFNSGYVGAINGAADFLKWWWDQTHYNCISEPMIGIFNEQSYLNEAIVLVKDLVILRSSGYNVAVWNLHERIIEKIGSQYLVNGEPLTFFHYSQARAKRINIRTPLAETNLIEELYADYVNELSSIKAGIQSNTYAYKYFDDGTLISAQWREWMRQDYPELRGIKNPFQLTFLERKDLEKKMQQHPANYRPNISREVNHWQFSSLVESPTLKKLHSYIFKLEYKFNSFIPLGCQIVILFYRRSLALIKRIFIKSKVS